MQVHSLIDAIFRSITLLIWPPLIGPRIAREEREEKLPQKGEEDNLGGGTESRGGRQKGRKRHKAKKRREGVTETATQQETTWHSPNLA